MGFFEKLKSGLTKTRRNFTDRITELVGMSAKVDEDFLEELEMILLTADVGVKTTEKLIEDVRQAAKKKEIKGTEDVLPFLKKQIAAMLKDDGVRTRIGAHPTVILVVGVNGVGKTTTIGKLSNYFLSCSIFTKACLLNIGSSLQTKQPLRPYTSPLLSFTSLSLIFTLMILDTPDSSMVTPYMTLAASIVPFRWVMTINWVCMAYPSRNLEKRPIFASSRGASISSRMQKGDGW